MVLVPFLVFRFEIEKILALQKSIATFSLTPQAQRKSYQKETPKRFALCGGRQGLLALDLATF
jgi:hypothetical protein